MLLSCTAATARAAPARVQIRLTRQEIPGTLGKPQAARSMVVTGISMWGPGEGFWDEVPEGTPLKVWSHRSERGQLDTHFLAADDRLDYRAFTPGEVVDESSP